LSQQDPQLLGKIIQQRLDIGLTEIYEQHKKAGLSVTYRDNAYPGHLVQEAPDGSRYLIDLDPKNGYQAKIIRPIPPRQTLG
jgi:hypothetical protein